MKIMFTKKHLAALVLAAGGMALSATSAQAVLLIDHFNDSQIVTDTRATAGSTSNGPLALTVPTASGIAGIDRTLTAHALPDGGAGSMTIDINPGTTGLLTISNNFSSAGTARVLYGTFDAAVDFTAEGTTILLDVLSIDTGVNVELIVNGTSSSGVQGFTGPGTFYVLMSSFTDPSVFSAVTSLELVFTGGTAWDGTFDYLRTDDPPSLPEPTSIALMSLGLAGPGVWRRRKA